MSIRNLIHLFLAIPTLAGVGLLLIFFVNAGSSDLTDEPGTALSIQAWSNILEAIPAEMPAAYPEEPEELPDSAEDLSEEMKTSYFLSNALIVSCSFLMLLGVVGLALMGIRFSHFEPAWNGFLRIGALSMVTLGGFLLFGFNMAYPGEFGGIFSLPAPYRPGSIDSVEYGLYGISEWADLLFIAIYALFFATLILSLVSAGIRSTPLFLVAIPASTLFFPLVVSWKWGAGWLDEMMNNYDFGGAALLHWHVGAGVLAISLIATLFRKSSSQKTEAIAPTTQNTILYAVGGVFYLVALLALNAGSTLQATPSTVAPVLQVSLVAAGIAGALGALWALLSPTRPFLRYFITGMAAGLVAVSGSADLLTLPNAITFGVVTGILVPGLVFLLESIGWTDSLSVGAVHGLGGLIAILGTGFVANEDATLVGQMILVLVIPLLTLMAAIFVTLIAGAAKYLILPTEGSPAPPPMPQSE